MEKGLLRSALLRDDNRDDKDTICKPACKARKSHTIEESIGDEKYSRRGVTKQAALGSRWDSAAKAAGVKIEFLFFPPFAPYKCESAFRSLFCVMKNWCSSTRRVITFNPFGKSVAR